MDSSSTVLQYTKASKMPFLSVFEATSTMPLSATTNIGEIVLLHLNAGQHPITYMTSDKLPTVELSCSNSM